MSSQLWEDPKEEPGSSFRHRGAAKSDIPHPNTDNSRQGRSKKSVWTRTWLRVNRTGSSELIDVGKHPIMRSTGISARDLRVLDPILAYPSSITGRERAILLNMEHVKGIVTARDFWLLNPKDPAVVQFAEGLQMRIREHHEANEENTRGGDATGEGGVDEGKEKLKNLPFEFVALEACLETVCNCLDHEAKSMEVEAYPALDKLTSEVTTRTLDRVRQIKSRLAALRARVKQVRDLIEHLLEHYDAMADMYLTKKSLMRETQEEDDQAKNGDNGGDDCEDDRDGEDDDDDDEEENPQLQTLERALVSETEGVKNSNKHLEVAELEMILDAYFVQAEGANNKLSTLQDYVDNTEAYVNIMLDGRQNVMLKLMVLVATGTVMCNFQNVVTGLFGMNLTIAFTDPPDRPITNFMYIVGFSVVAAVIFYVAAIAWYKYKRLV